ncbi:MAG: hypothetical protein WEA09_08060 [Gemmatimonadota bacterium]
MTQLLVWQVGPVRVRAEVPLAAPLATWVRRLYPDARSDAGSGFRARARSEALESGPVMPDETILLESGTDGFHVSRGDRIAGPLSPEDAFVAFELELSRALLEHQPTLPLHGGGAAGSSGAVLLSGPGESGKSTLTASLALAGYPVFGDDVILVDGSSGYIQPFPRLLKLTEPARSSLGIPEKDRWARRFPLVDATLIHPRGLGSGWSPPAPLTAVIFPHRDPDWQENPRWEPVPPSRAMALLMAQRIFPVRDPGRDFQILADVVGAASTVEVHYREAAQLVGRLEEWLGTPIPPTEAPGS